jgi:hypothetical protein
MTDVKDRATNAADEFYVGYLPVPAGQRVFLRFALPGLLWLMVAVAALAAAMQRDPGDAVWHEAESVFSGQLVADPYARLILDEQDGTWSSLFLVEAGKLGGGARAEAFAGQRVEIRGTLLERDGRRILELAPGEGAMRAIDPETTAAADREQLETRSLVGEIVDFKCYLGAMKPGEGKTHRVCATLCVRGGIPPALVTTDASGKHTYYVLVGANGQTLNEAVLAYIAEPVRVSGQIETSSGALFLRTSVADIERLH